MKINISELAIEARSDNKKMENLWNAVYRLIAWWANKYSTDQGTRNWETDDLIQTGFFALHEAVQSFDPKRSGFTTHLRYFIRSHFSKVIGTRDSKIRPELHAISLNETIDDESGTTRTELLPDPTAEFEDNIIHTESVRQDFATLFTEIEKLPDMQRRALMLTAYKGLTLEKAGERMGVSGQGVNYARASAVRAVRRSRAFRLMNLERRNLFKHVSVKRYFHTRMSAVEIIVLDGLNGK